jgi:FkbM family methyltransferase
MRVPKPNLNVIELAILVAPIVVLSSMLSYKVGVADTQVKLLPFISRDNEEIEALEHKYGPSRFTQGVEEWILKDFFQNRRNGVFVDVGANHHQTGNNTYYLETVMGWSGVAIEPQVKFAAGYREHRPRTIFLPLFISDVSDEQATLYVANNNDLVSSGVREFTESWGAVTSTTTTTATLDDVLDRLKIERIDFLSMDIELAEPQALAGFSIKRFAPALVAIEAHPPVRQQILDYFFRNGYILVGRYWRADTNNFWFAPFGTAPADSSHDVIHTH